MRVLHFLDTLSRGGAETLVLDVCRNAGRADLDVDFVTSGGGLLLEEFERSGADFFRLKRRLPFDPVLVSGLRKIIINRKIDIIHTHQAVDALHALAARSGLPTRVVLTHHGIIPDRKNRLALRFLIPRVDHNIVVAQSMKKDYEAELKLRFPVKTSVIYNGVDTERLAPSSRNFRAELGVSTTAPLIGMIGHFYRESRKDQMTLCRALPKVFADFPNAHCVFAGQTMAGAESKFAECVNFCRENGIDGKVSFLGARSDVPDILSALDLFVFSSLKEGLPIAVNEAMLTCVPVIVSDIEPLLEATANGEYGEVFPVKNAEILSEKILKLLRDNDLRKHLADKALQYARENFSIEAHLRELKKLYQSLKED
jgi:glycosyltransferase involved in cell wall biosynthesis